jgi:putative NADH-flavin reductase
VKIFVIGATGHTGMQVLDLALSRGHEVTAFVRSPQKIGRRDARLKIVTGDPESIEQLTAAMPAHDLVITALGVRPPRAFRPHSLVTDCVAATVSAMKRSGISRIVLVSAAVLFPERGLVFAIFRRLLKHIARDLAQAEEIISRSGLDWTIVRPPRLTNGTDERYRVLENALPKNGFSVSFRAVAAFMLDSAEHRSHVQELVGLAKG